MDILTIGIFGVLGLALWFINVRLEARQGERIAALTALAWRYRAANSLITEIDEAALDAGWMSADQQDLRAHFVRERGEVLADAWRTFGIDSHALASVTA